MTPKSLAVFAHFDRQGRVTDYVVEYVRCLRAEVDALIFVSASKLAKKELAKLTPWVTQAVVRENVGYDFMSWQTGLAEAGELAGYDEVIIANDSCYGPLFPLQEMLTAMRARRCDFWGMTASREIHYHLQSYFMVFDRAVVASAAFRNFWASVRIVKDKNEVVRQYEVGLSRALCAVGFKPAAYAEVQSSGAIQGWARLTDKVWMARQVGKVILGRAGAPGQRAFNRREMLRLAKSIWWGNASLYGYRLGLRWRLPLIKVMLIRDNLYPGQTRQGYLQEIARYSGYDVSLIRRHLEIKD